MYKMAMIKLTGMYKKSRASIYINTNQILTIPVGGGSIEFSNGTVFYPEEGIEEILAKIKETENDNK